MERGNFPVLPSCGQRPTGIGIGDEEDGRGPDMDKEEFRVEELDGTPVVCLTGDVDFITARDLERLLGEILEDGQSNVVVDMQDVTFCCSATVGTLVGCAGRYRKRGGELRVCCVPRSAQEILGMLGVKKFVAVYGERSEALLASPEEVRASLGIASAASDDA
jgi:anti-anti-sigma factor